MNFHVYNLLKFTNEGMLMKTLKKWWLVILVGLIGLVAGAHAADNPKFELQLKGQPVGITCYKPAGCWRAGLVVMTRNPEIDMLPGDDEVMRAVGFDVVKEGEIKPPSKPPFEPEYSVTVSGPHAPCKDRSKCNPDNDGKVTVSVGIEHETWSESISYRCDLGTGKCEETIRGGGG